MMRKKIPRNLEKKVLIKNRHCCCVCQRDGFGQEVNIHHIDGNNRNNVISNLAVLCLVHASKADAGLSKGKQGSGKKLKPDEIREYKRIWERKIQLESKIQKKTLPTYERKQLEILYNFEIHKLKNEISSLRDTDKRVKEKFRYFDQLSIEDFISGIGIRKILLGAYSDLALQTIDSTEKTKRLAESIWFLSCHLIGPHEVRLDYDDKKILLKSLDILKTMGNFAAPFSKTPVLKKICKTLYDLYEISNWYEFKSGRVKTHKILTDIKRACLEFKEEKKTKQVIKQRKERQMIVSKTLTKIKKLGL